MNILETWAGESLKNRNGPPSRATHLLEGEETGRFFLLKSVAHGEGQGPAAEALGLRLLGGTASVPVPKVFGWDESRILMEWVEAVPATPKREEEFGRRLAQLHRADVAFSELPARTFCGPTAQENCPWTDWRSFFWEHRLCRLARTLEDGAPGMKGLCAQLDKVWSRIEAVVPAHVFPALVHGDLWSGNIVYGRQGGTLIDPAVYLGHREVDLAMMRLFGGVGERVLDAYREVLPLESSWEERVSIYNLYHLLNHGILFGGGYLKSVQEEVFRLQV